MTTRYALRVRYIPAKSSSKKNLFCSRPEGLASLKLIILRGFAIILGLRLWAIGTRDMARHLGMILPQDHIMFFQ